MASLHDCTLVYLILVGDWHIAYLLLYSPLRLEKIREEEESEKPTEEEQEAMETQQSTDKPSSS